MSALAENIEGSDTFADTDIFIDGFSDFMPAHYSVIEALIKNAHSVTVVLSVNDSALRGGDGIFAPVLSSMYKLENIAKELGAECRREHLSGEYNYIKAEDIRYFLKNYDEYTDLTPPPLCENIALKSFHSRHGEVEHLAGRIMHEVRENGLRFRDIGVIVGNTDAYLHIIDSVFSSYGIAYSADTKLAATEHPVVRLVLSVFKIITDNWSYSSVFEYLRSGFVYRKKDGLVLPVDQRDIDKLELYVKSRGIRGKNVWLSEDSWKLSKTRIFDEATGAKDTKEDIEALDIIRRELMSPFRAFTEKIKGRQKVRSLAAALFEFLEDICLFEGLSLEKKHFEDKNMLDEATRLASVWDIILETLDQSVIVSGDEYMSREDFYRLLESGFSKCSIDIVPSGADRVSVGRADMSRPVRVKTLFVLGAVRGELPCEVSDFGIINGADRAQLTAAGFDYFPDKAAKTALAEFNLFWSLTAGYERLYVSYPEFNDEGAKTAPAPVVSEILRFFDTNELSGNNDVWEDIFASKQGTYNKLVSRLGGNISAAERELWDSVWDLVKPVSADSVLPVAAADNADYSVFEQIEAERRDLLSELSDYRTGKTHIKPETAAMLYGERTFSISALQKYNKCPFSYFASYGLGIACEEERKVRASDIGTMVHWAVCEYCKIVQEGAETHAEKKARWERLDKTSSDKIISELTERITEITKEANPDFTPERIEMMCWKSASTLKRSAEIIRKSLTEGEFAAYEFEKPFKFTLEGKTDSVELYGVIDRTDIAESENGKLLRIIDYKTGEQKFSVAGIYNKTDLQLIIYALAAEDMYKEDKAKVGAVMYDKISDELQRTELGLAASIAPAPLDGIIIHDDDKTPEEEIVIHSRELAEDGAACSFLPLSNKKKGGLKKNGIVISRSKFDILRRYVTKTAIDTKLDIYNGNVSAYPLGEGDYSPCTWCDYSAICLYDKERDGARELVTSKQTAWDKLETEDKAE